MLEFDPVDRVTADAIGEPGQREFFIQARMGSEVVSVLVEKQQVQLLAASVLEVLARADAETDIASVDAGDTLALEEPVETRWRVGRLSIGYEEQRDMILLELDELLDDDQGEEDERERDHVRLWATREQMLALAQHGAEVCERGRPLCELCGNPKDPTGHACPATNGHKKPTTIT